MSAADLARARATYAHARESRGGVGQAFERLRTALNDELAHEIRMRRAYAELDASMARVAMECQTARETLAFGAGQ